MHCREVRVGILHHPVGVLPYSKLPCHPTWCVGACGAVFLLLLPVPSTCLVVLDSTEHDSDSDSELSLDEHSSSYASSHSSDSEEEAIGTEKKWNTATSKNSDRGPLHSTPKGKGTRAKAMVYGM